MSNVKCQMSNVKCQLKEMLQDFIFSTCNYPTSQGCYLEFTQNNLNKLYGILITSIICDVHAMSNVKCQLKEMLQDFIFLTCN